MNKKILVLDYKVGNVNSVLKAVKHFGFEPVLSNRIDDLENADKIILPGQGSYDYAINKIDDLNLREPIIKAARKKKKILGICLGMQLLSSFGYENKKKTKGLGLISGNVVKMSQKNIKLPHIGWSTVKQNKKSKIFFDIPNNSDFYHCHSYVFETENKNNILATSRYKIKFTTAISSENIYGVQFHPEKSLKFGLKLIKNFLDFE